MNNPNTPSPSPEPAVEHPSPRKFKPGPVLNFENDEVAASSGEARTQAHKDAATMLLGYGSVLLGTITLKHGAVSTRPKSDFALEKLEKSFEENGVLRYSNPIVLLVELDDLECDSPLASKLDGDIPSVAFVAPQDGAKPVVLCVAGQHREEVVLRRVQKLASELDDLKESEDVDQSAIQALEGRIQGERLWAAAFYKKCKSIRASSDAATDADAKRLVAAVLNSKNPSAIAVGNLLSSNQRLWQWEATPQELWQLGCHWILRFGTERKILLKAIGETRKFPWLGGLLVKAEWRDALTTLLKYPGLNKDALLKECGQWCTQPHSQIALFFLQGLVSNMVALSSTSNTHYPELWSSELSKHLHDQWALVHRQIEGSASSDREVLVDEYHRALGVHLAQEWEARVPMEDGEAYPTIEDILEGIYGRVGDTEPILLSWEELKPRINEWKSCGEGLNEITRWLDPAMGEFHSRSHGAVKLGTATEYIWFDMPKSPNVDMEVHQRDFAQLLSDLHSDLRNMTIAVLDVRGRTPVQLSESDEEEIDRLVDFYVSKHRVQKKSQPSTASNPIQSPFQHSFSNLQRHTAIQFDHFDSRNRPKHYRRYITALVSESELQKLYLPVLLQHSSVRRVRIMVQDFYQARNSELSIFWNNFGGEALQKGKKVGDDYTYDQHLQTMARDSILRQLATPYKRLVESGGIPRGLARDAMVGVLGAISRHLGEEDDVDDEDADGQALGKLLGPSLSDEEYIPRSESELEDEQDTKRSRGKAAGKGKSVKRTGSSKKKAEKEARPGGNATSDKKGPGGKRTASAKAQAATITQIDEQPLLQQSATVTKRPATAPQAPSSPSSVDVPPLPNEEDVETSIQQQDAESPFDGQSLLEATLPTADFPNLTSSRKDRGQSLKASSSSSATAGQSIGGRDVIGTATTSRANTSRVNSRPSIQSVDPSQMVSPNRVATRGSSAKRLQQDSRSGEAGPSAPRFPTSLRPEEQYQTPIPNPFMKGKNLAQAQQPSRPTGTPVKNPFAIKNPPGPASIVDNPARLSATFKDGGGRQKRVAVILEDSDVEEVETPPAAKKTRLASKDKVTFRARRAI